MKSVWVSFQRVDNKYCLYFYKDGRINAPYSAFDLSYCIDCSYVQNKGKYELRLTFTNQPPLTLYCQNLNQAISWMDLLNSVPQNDFLEDNSPQPKWKESQDQHLVERVMVPTEYYDSPRKNYNFPEASHHSSRKNNDPQEILHPSEAIQHVNNTQENDVLISKIDFQTSLEGIYRIEKKIEQVESTTRGIGDCLSFNGVKSCSCKNIRNEVVEKDIQSIHEEIRSILHSI